jgi:signal transduction histidine kinase
VVQRQTPTAAYACLFMLACLLFFICPSANAQIRQIKKVLLLEDQTSAPANDAIERELLLALDAKSPNPIEYYRESLDTILIQDKTYPEEVREWYEHKYAKRQLDLIISIGPESHEFLRKSHEKFFHGIPVVFCLDHRRPDIEGDLGDPNFTGVWMDMDPASTVDVARQFLPDTKRVAIISGTGYFDQMLTTAVQRKLQGYSGVEFTYLTDLDLSSLLKRIASLPKDTVILFLTLTKDPSLNHFFARDTLHLVSNSTNVPVFGLINTMVGRGLVGGRVTDFTGQGSTVADMATRILGGQKPESIPVATARNEYSFDWRELQRWKLNAARLPPGSVLLNREPSVWEKYKRIIVLGCAIFLFQTALLLYLLIERARRRRAQRALELDIVERKKAEEALMDLSGRLINAQEEERSRIARELHDDFNQRLGMLAIDLERVAPTVREDPENAVQRLHELWKQITALGGDLNAMSHTLHSSVLDYLGLVEGIRSLCDDFSQQQELVVDFTSQDVARSISPGTSLCLFRIAQEALRNVKKHSGAAKASVELYGRGKEIVLMITDEGVGFEPKQSTNQNGLGLRSMQERLRTVGGTIEIQSKNGNGTRILVRAPV